MNPDQNNPYVYQQVSYSRQDKLPVRKLVLWFSLLVTALVALQWISSHSYVEIIVDSQSNDPVTYELSTSVGKKTELKNSPKSIKKLVSRGEYEILVTQGETNHFSVVKTGGFLGTTKVSTKPEAERGRRFVGNLPKSCMYFLDNTLLSYHCGGTLSDIQTHIPATASLPTYTKRSSTLTDDVIESLIRTSEGDVLFVYESELAGHEDVSEAQSPHVTFLLKKGVDIDLTNRAELAGLSEELYSFQAYKEGFLSYNEDFSKIFYHASLKAKPVAIELPRPIDSDFRPYTLHSGKQEFAVAYSESGKSENSSKSEVTVVKDKQTRQYRFNKSFSNIRVCGENRLCGVSNGNLEIYDTSKDRHKLLHTISGNVSTIEVIGDRLVVVREKNVISLNLASMSGAVQYSFGDYGFCGIQPAAGSYLLCLKTSRDTDVALYIDQNKQSDNIDKMVAELLASKDITAVTAYGRYVSITPDAGGLSYIKSTDNFGYDPGILKNINAKLAQQLKELGFGEKGYQVTNTLE